ncbi:MAG: preprotein translocase subunit SecG [Candidatus Yonathbacteria bacterium]|nr:preprotein translocase subunit SecG [Candidatus Yonathbacteria bacterium]
MEFLGNIGAYLPWVQTILAILLIISVLLQQTGAGLGGAFGGADSMSGFHERRGAEKTLFYATIILAILFAVSTFLSLVL